MKVYGDPKRIKDPRRKAEAIRRVVERWAAAPHGIERHSLLVELLIEAGELEQGLLDHRLARDGEERPSNVGRAAGGLTRAIARALAPSFRSRGLAPAEPGPIAEALVRIENRSLPEAIEISLPEGFAFYALYPETYLEAARKAFRDAPAGPARVLGLRSIGTGLAAVVAAGAEATGRSGAVVNVRPTGHPFARKIVVGPEIESDLLEAAGDPPLYAVVDEGPGLSGSSFGGAADWLEDRGVEPEAIRFFPSHAGAPGPQAGERHRRRWEGAHRHVVDFDELFAAPGCRWPLADWVSDLTGEAEAPLADLGAGRWRERLFLDPASRPAADTRSERRKYLLAAGGRSWLLKFAGFGRQGREALALARRLSGLIPPVVGLRHGFLVSPWLDDVRPLPLATVDRRQLLAAVERYLARRASLPAPPEGGAAPDELFEMLRHNAGTALGPRAAAAVEAWESRLSELSRLARPIATDNRMQAWEWLVTPAGEILKADALDHHRGNDLVGSQDLAWDLAGAAEELDLTVAETEALAGGFPTAPFQLAFYRLAYLAFELGRDTLAAAALEDSDGAEAAGLRARAELRAERLRRFLT